jgi:hypothetical protein
MEKERPNTISYKISQIMGHTLVDAIIICAIVSVVAGTIKFIMWLF